jgi:hypothetical protein
MNLLPQHAAQRAARINLGDGIPAVLRNQEGSCEQGQLKTVSLTGGLLHLPQGLDKGSSFRLMFVTHTGPVLGTAEMLPPVSNNLQPFRFVSLHQTDKRRLGEAIRTCLEPDNSRQQWIEKYRAAAALEEASGKRRKRAMGVAAVVVFSLASVLYLFHAYLR